jgi:O-antigen/teichoic acid export membrane protein
MSTQSVNEPDVDEPGQTPEPSFLQTVIKQYTGLSKDMLIYGFSGSLGQLASLISVTITSRILTVAQFGNVYIIYATINYFAILMTFQIGAGLWRYYYEVPDHDLQERRRMVSSLLWFILGIGIPLALVIASFGRELSIKLFGSADNTLAIQLAVLGLPVMAVYNLFVGLQRLKRRPIAYLSISLGYSLAYLLMIAVFVGWIKVGLKGIFLAQLIAYSCAALAAFWLGRELVAFTFSKDWFLKMAAYGLPMVPGAILSWSLVAINRYYLNAFVGPEQVGYYTLASNIALAMALIVSSFTMAWQPFMLANLRNPNSHRMYSLTLNYYALVTLLIGAGLAIFAREIVLIVSTPAYLPAAGLISILVVRQILTEVDMITGVGIVISKKTIFTSLALAIGVAFNLVGDVLLAPRWGMYGAAFAETVGVFAAQAVIFIISNWLFEVKWDAKFIIRCSLGYLIVVLISYTLPRFQLDTGWLFLLKTGLLAGYAVFLMRLIDPNERSILLKIPVQMFAWTRTKLLPHGRVDSR